MSSIRQVDGVPEVYTQGTTEKIQYVFHFDKMLSTIGLPSTPTFKVYEMKNGADVTATKAPGAAGLTGLEFTSPLVIGLERDVMYRLVAEVLVGLQSFSSYKDVLGEL